MTTRYFTARLNKAIELIKKGSVRLNEGTATIYNEKNMKKFFSIDRIEIVGAKVEGSQGDLYLTHIQKTLKVSIAGRSFEEWKITCVNQSTSSKVQTHCCKGNENANTVCYHCLATLLKLASLEDKCFILTDTQEELKGIKGKIVKIINAQNGNIMWGIITNIIRLPVSIKNVELINA